MKELRDTLDKVASIDAGNGMDWHDPAALLDEVAVKWSAHSLATYKGKRLRKALAISAALAEFAMLGRQP